MDKAKRERVKALKEQDFNAYLDLVTKSKNKRIIELLASTDNYLRSLGAKVRI